MGANGDAKPFDFVTLLFGQIEWVRRRVESIRLDDTGASIVRVSLDMALPDQVLVGPLGGRVLPIAIAAKGPITRFDIGVEGLRSRVLTTSENSELIAVEVGRMLDKLDSSLHVDSDQLRQVFEARPNEARGAWEGLSGQLDSLRGVDSDLAAQVLTLLELLVDRYVILVEFTDALPRHFILKYSYDAGKGPAFDVVASEGWLVWDVDAFGSASSSHVEVEVPYPLLLGTSEIWTQDGADIEVNASAVTRSAIHHLVARPRNALSTAIWVSRVYIQESALTRVALGSSVVSMVLCAYLYVGAWAPAVPGAYWVIPTINLDPAVSLIVAVAAAVGPIIGREPRHATVASYVRPFRTATSFSTALMFGLALVTATVPRSGQLQGLQFVFVVASLALTVWVLVLRKRVSPRPSMFSSRTRR